MVDFDFLYQYFLEWKFHPLESPHQTHHVNYPQLFVKAIKNFLLINLFDQLRALLEVNLWQSQLYFANIFILFLLVWQQVYHTDYITHSHFYN